MRTVMITCLLASALQAEMITTSGQGFTTGPVTFSNVRYTNSATAGLPIMGFSLIPDVYPDPLWTPEDIILLAPGRYHLEPSSVARRVSETISADFTISGGYELKSITAIGNLDSPANPTGTGILFNGPCSFTLSGGAGPSGGFCNPIAGTQSGNLNFTLEIYSSPCITGVPCHFGEIGLAHVRFVIQQRVTEARTIHNPEPETYTLIGLGIVLTALSRFATRRV